MLRRTALSLAFLLIGQVCHAKLLEVKSGYSYPPRVWLTLFHESPIPWLSVGGKKYLYAMGSVPYSLKVPVTGRNMIFFITSDQSQGEFVYHFVSLDDGKDIAIKVRNTYLDIGLSASSSRGVVSFELVDWPKIVILAKREPGPGWEAAWWRYSFDLEKLTVVDTRG